MFAQVEAQFAEELEGLRILTELTRGGVLAFGLYSEVRIREGASEWLKNKSTLPVQIVQLSDGVIDLVQIIGYFPSDSRHCFVFFDIEAAFPKILGYVNLHRERLFHFGQALVFWIREEGLRRIAESAPDFWAWRSNVFDFRTAQDLSLGPTGLHDAVVGHYSKAQLLEQVQSLAESGALDFVTQLALGRRQLALGRFEEADKALQQAVAEAERQGDQRGLAEALDLLGSSKIAQGFTGTASAILDRSFDIAKQTGPGVMAVTQSRRLSERAQVAGETEAAYDLAKSALALAANSGDPNALACAHEQMGNVLFGRKDLRDAEQEFLSAVKYEEQLSHRTDLAVTLLKLSRVYEEMGAATKASVATERAIALLQEFGWDQTEITKILEKNGG
jgi:tetratricopeptide (TPR) repeat protein